MAKRRWILVLSVAILGMVRLANGAEPVQPDKYSLEVWGSNHSGEARFMFLGRQGGALGFYGGLAEEELLGEQGITLRFGGVARYNVITSGEAPVGNLLPGFLDWFKQILGLPATTPADTYVGLALGGAYAPHPENMSFEVRPVVGVRIAMFAAEVGRGLGDVIGEPDTPSAWTWNLGLVFPF